MNHISQSAIIIKKDIELKSNQYIEAIQKAKILFEDYVDGFYKKIKDIQEFQNIKFSFIGNFEKLVFNLLNNDNVIDDMKVITVNILNYSNPIIDEKNADSTHTLNNKTKTHIEYNVMVTDISGLFNYKIEKIIDSKFYLYDFKTNDWIFMYEDSIESKKNDTNEFFDLLKNHYKINNLD